MTAQELYEIVRKEIDVRAFYDPNYRTIQQKIDSNKANFEDTAQLSRLLSQILGEKLASHILELPPNEGRSKLCQKLLRDFFNEINHRLAQVQTSQDRKNGVGLGAVKPQFPAERVQNVAGSLNDTTVSDSTIQRRCRNAVANVANSMHDTFIQVNAKFRNDAGLFVQVSRTGGADCCEWCAEVSGTFLGYNRDLREVFRRHDNCTCTITYSSSKTRSRLVGESDGAGGTTSKWVESRKSWQENPILPDVRPTRFTPEQAKRFETEQLRKQGLVRDGNGVKWVGNEVTNEENSNEMYNLFRSIEYDEKNPVLVERAKKITLHRVINSRNHIYVSEGVRNNHMKPKELHQIDKHLSEVYKMMGIENSENLPNVYIVDEMEMGSYAVASYNAILNVLYLNRKYATYLPENLPEGIEQFSCGTDDRSSYVHELYHWFDAEKFRRRYGAVTEENYNDYVKFINDEAKKKLDKLIKKGYNLNDSSSYARKQYEKQKYYETYTEYRVTKLLEE